MPARHAACALFAVVVQAHAALAGPLAPRRDLSAPSIAIPIAVFGEDERHDLAPTRAVLAASIGFLVLGDQSFCTAFCAGDDIIATASHCLLGTEQTPGPDLERVSFEVGEDTQHTARLAGGSRTAIRSALRSGTKKLRVTPPIAAVNDWALARLTKPVCAGNTLALSTLSRAQVVERAAQGGVYQVAMHRDISPDKLVSAGPCRIGRSFPQAGEEAIAQDFIEPSAILMHTCDTGAGSSGSPLLTDGPDGPEVIGLNVGTYVLSRTNASTSSTGAGAVLASEAIANTAIEAPRLKAALQELSADEPIGPDVVKDVRRAR